DVAEDDGLTLGPVLVEDLNAVFGGDRTHGRISCALSGELARIASAVEIRRRPLRCRRSSFDPQISPSNIASASTVMSIMLPTTTPPDRKSVVQVKGAD